MGLELKFFRKLGYKTEMERFGKLAAECLNHVLASPIQVGDLEVPPDPTLGDFGFPCFKLAKEFRKSPPQVAQQLVADIQSKGVLPRNLSVAAVGPYVNFTAAPEVVLGSLLKDILTSHDPISRADGLGTYGSLPPETRGSWVLEYSSPNVAKPLNIYHLRPTALGAALDRVGRYRGFKVVSINHLGDWGKQYGMLAVAFEKYGHTVDSNLTMSELVDLYVKINADAENDRTLGEQARAAFLKLEQGEPAITALWKKCLQTSMEEFDSMYERLNVRFDHVWGESFYQKQLAPLIEDLKKRGILELSEGAWVVQVTDPQGKELPPCIVQKSDGATIYATRDLAAAIYRYNQFHFDRMTYIVGTEQRLHFQQVFAVLRKMGLPWASKVEHIPFGHYRFKDAKMSTRKGNFVTLEEVLELAKDRVGALMQERGKSLGPVEQEAVNEAIAVGAVVFHDLATDPIKDVEFDVERVVDFEGETGPYLQYAHTRCLSILRKARETGQLPAESSVPTEFYSENLISHLTAPEELALVKMLGQFPIHLERTLVHAKASQLAHFLIDVTKAFGLFYRECHVLDEAKPELTKARLMLVEATRRILARGLGLLGIPLPTKM